MTGKNDTVTGSPSGDGGFTSGDENYKVLYLIRHAKSSWDADVPSDFDRPLNERGKKDAPVMAARLKDKKFTIDAYSYESVFSKMT